jgi:hypothetical protein
VRSRILLCLIGSLCSCTSSRPASAADELRALIGFLEAVHPRPHAYVDEVALHSLLDEESARLEALDEPDDLAVGRSFHRVLASLGDGHLALALPSFQPEQLDVQTLLPVLPKRAGATTFVDAAGEALPRGTVLLAIEGVPIEELYASLGELVMADGRSQSARTAQLERSFARFYHLLHGTQPAYRVRVRQGAEERELTLPGLNRAQLAELASHRHSAPVGGLVPADTAWPELVRLDERTVLLRLASFASMDQDGYLARVDALFAALSGEERLVLDLRGNEGGYRTHGISVLNHVLSRPYAMWSRMRARVQRIPAPYRARVSFPLRPEEALRAPFANSAPSADGYVREGDPLSARMVPTGAPWRGRVVVFADAITNSAAVETLGALLAFGDQVLFIGQETGGECGRHVGEMPVVYTEASQGLRVLISLFELTHVPVIGCLAGRGYRPAREVTYDERAFIEGIDPYLVALDLP